MSIKSSQYESLLSYACQRAGALALLYQHRPYLELIPSMRRPIDSILAIPLPVVKTRGMIQPTSTPTTSRPGVTTVALPCDLAIITCDPEWKIKMGPEILLFIHRPNEDFSQLLRRWRETQVIAAQDYEWVMPTQEEHMLSEGSTPCLPLFALFPETRDRIREGLVGAGLPTICHQPNHDSGTPCLETFSSQEL